MKDEESATKKANRQNKLRPRGRRHWCACDMFMLSWYGQCRECGRKAKNFNKRRLKGF